MQQAMLWRTALTHMFTAPDLAMGDGLPDHGQAPTASGRLAILDQDLRLTLALSTSMTSSPRVYGREPREASLIAEVGFSA
jgi:hypothetical protein